MSAHLTLAEYRLADREAVTELDGTMVGPAPFTEAEPHDVARVVRCGGGDAEDVVAYFSCGPLAGFDDPALCEMTVATSESVTLAEMPDELLPGAFELLRARGARNLVTRIAADDAPAARWLAGNGFALIGRLSHRRRPAGAQGGDGDGTRFQVRPFEPGEYTADSVVGLAAGTLGEVLLPAPERLVERHDTLRVALLGGTGIGRVFAAFDGWPAVGWAVLSEARHGEADLILAHVMDGYAGQSVLAGLLGQIVEWADESGLNLRASLEPEREPELAAVLSDCGFAETSAAELWQMRLDD